MDTLFIFLGYIGETLKKGLGDSGHNQRKKLGYILSGRLGKRGRVCVHNGQKPRAFWTWGQTRVVQVRWSC